jgi:hypothetical protein
MVISSVKEFGPLAEASGDPVPKDVIRERKAVVRRGLPEDPLGYDYTNIETCALAMAEAALSGRTVRSSIARSGQSRRDSESTSERILRENASAREIDRALTPIHQPSPART